jgi:DNA polymerase-3 subunit delta'
MRSIYPWQQQEWQQLFSRKNSGQLPHAILIKGMEGVGKYHFALCLAEVLLCQKGSTRSCGECSACQLLKSNNHPDLIIIKPEEENKAIKIDQIRELVYELNNTSQQGGYKIVIIEHAELLNIAASNSLLKTLEEPAVNVIIILLSHHPAILAATIRSRCQTIAIKTPVFNTAQEWLKQQAPEADLKLALALAENAPLKALSILQEKNLQRRLGFFQNLYALQDKKINAVQAAEQYLDWDFRSLLLTFMRVVSDLIKIKCTAIEYLVNQDQTKELICLAAKTDLNKLFTYQKQLLKLHQYFIRNINFNQQLTAESLTITWTQLFINTDISNI